MEYCKICKRKLKRGICNSCEEKRHIDEDKETLAYKRQEEEFKSVAYAHRIEP